MALINQNTLFDRLKEYIDKRIRFLWNSPHDDACELNDCGSALEVADVAFLRAVEGMSDCDMVVMKSFKDVGDDGGGTFVYDSTKADIDDGGIIIKGWVRKREADDCNVKWFGAKGDDVTDDTQAIKNALAAISYGTVSFPAGVYRISETITINTNHIRFKGSSVGPTVLKATTDYGHILEVGTVDNTRIDGFVFTSLVQRTYGGAIRVYNAHNCKIDHVRFDSFLHSSVIFESHGTQFLYYLSDFEINSGLHGIEIGIGTDIVQDVFIDNGIIANTTGAGILVGNSTGIYANSVDILACDSGFVVSPGAGERAGAMLLSQIICDSSYNSSGFMFLAGDSLIHDVTLVGCYASSNALHGITIEANKNVGGCKNIAVNSSIISNNGGFGLFFDETSESISSTNSTYSCNSTLTYSTGVKYYGIGIADNSKEFTITGGLAGRAGLFPENLQDYGIYIGAGCDNFSVTGVNLMNNAVSGLINNSRDTATDMNVVGNISHYDSKTTDSFTANYINALDGEVNATNTIRSIDGNVEANNGVVSGGTVEVREGNNSYRCLDTRDSIDGGSGITETSDVTCHTLTTTDDNATNLNNIDIGNGNLTLNGVWVPGTSDVGIITATHINALNGNLAATNDIVAVNGFIEAQSGDIKALSGNVEALDFHRVEAGTQYKLLDERFIGGDANPNPTFDTVTVSGPVTGNDAVTVNDGSVILNGTGDKGFLQAQYVNALNGEVNSTYDVKSLSGSVRSLNGGVYAHTEIKSDGTIKASGNIDGLTVTQNGASLALASSVKRWKTGTLTVSPPNIVGSWIHGLGYAPNASDFIATSIDNIGAANGATWWISAINTTGVSISVQTKDGGNLLNSISWAMSVRY